MRDGGNALRVPHCRKNRIKEARQAAPGLLWLLAVQRDHSGVPEVADGNGPRRGRWQGNAEAAIPQQTHTRRQPYRTGAAGELTQNEKATTPMDEAAAAERMSAAPALGQDPAQPG